MHVSIKSVLALTSVAVLSIATCTFSAPQTKTAPNPCAGENFYHGQMTDEEVFSEFRGSVFRIETTNESGTGYLIDSNRGYVLTAFHVVKSAYQNASATINAT